MNNDLIEIRDTLSDTKERPWEDCVMAAAPLVKTRQAATYFLCAYRTLGPFPGDEELHAKNLQELLRRLDPSTAQLVRKAMARHSL